MSGSQSSNKKKQIKRSDNQDTPGLLPHSASFLQVSRSYNDRPRLQLGGLGEVIKSIRNEQFVSNMDIPSDLFYKITGHKEGNPLPVGLAPVTRLNPSLMGMRQVPGTSGTAPLIEEISSTAVLPSISRPFGPLGIKEVEDDTSSSTDALLGDDQDDTEREVNSEARDLGINTSDNTAPNSWSYECLMDEEGIDLDSLMEGMNMFLMQARVSNGVTLEKVQLRGNRLYGYVTLPDDGNSTIWGSAKSNATLTEIPPSPVKNKQPKARASLDNIFTRSVPGPSKEDDTRSVISSPDPELTEQELEESKQPRKKKTPQIPVEKPAPKKVTKSQPSKNPKKAKSRDPEEDDVPLYRYIVLRLPARSALNKPVNLKLDYEKYMAIVETDLIIEQKIQRILITGQMYQKYFYRCDYTRGTLECIN